MEAASVEVLRQPGMGEIDCGQGIAQATLVAILRVWGPVVWVLVTPTE